MGRFDCSRGDSIAWVRVPSAESAAPKVQAVFRRSTARYGFVDNLVRVFALAPDHLPSFFAYFIEAIDADHGALTARERAILGVVVASENGSPFGLTSHAAALRALSSETALVETLIANHAHARLSPRERVVLDLAIKITQRPQALERADLDRPRAVGLDDAAVFQVVEYVAALNAVHRLANALGVAPNRDAAFFHAGHDFPIG